MSKADPKEATIFSITIKMDELGRIFLDKDFVPERALRRLHETNRVLPFGELVEASLYMHDMAMSIEHDLEGMLNRRP